ncbi:sporulation protein [Niallia nealsonii]|uniref:Sporulation protein n=1 Tax=Niallia nealsonii TaxID=115979 RepID=A0A2N0Z0F1_9BACI|nr:sporulation protein [Niallia nealsonii]PKG22992.1 sporulation protein [Niallia nealsonii]
MNESLRYIREILSLYTDRSDIGKTIPSKAENGSYKTEENFVRDLSPKEIDFLNNISKEESQYAKKE